MTSGEYRLEVGYTLVNFCVDTKYQQTTSFEIVISLYKIRLSG
jgi:hypothetical protein